MSIKTLLKIYIDAQYAQIHVIGTWRAFKSPRKLLQIPIVLIKGVE